MNKTSTRYPRLMQACEDNSLRVSHEYLGTDDYGKPQYLVKVNGTRIEIIATWGQEPAYECLSFMLGMASEMRDDKTWCESHQIPFNTDGYFNDHNAVYARLRRVLTDEQIVDFTLLVYDDENES